MADPATEKTDKTSASQKACTAAERLGRLFEEDPVAREEPAAP